MAKKLIGLLIVAAVAAACGGSSSGGAPTSASAPSTAPSSTASPTPADAGCAVAAKAGPVFGHWLADAGAALQKGNLKAGEADLAKAYAPIKRAQGQTTGDLSTALGRLGNDIEAFARLVRQHRSGDETAAEDTIGQDVSTIKALCP